MTALYPLSFRPILLPKVWGGRALERFGKVLPPDEPVGESWEIADLAQTSSTGAGGSAARSVVAHGPLAGVALGNVMRTNPVELLGVRSQDVPAEFPLLIKYLDAGEHLSLQVHPTAAHAAAHAGARVKHETWYILHAEPGAVLFKGVRPGVDAAVLADAIARGNVLDVVEAVPARAGDCHDLPSGTVHALGAGIVVAEVQTPSDTTYRLYDWKEVYDRPTRELHIRDALACADIGPAPDSTRRPDDRDRSRLVRGAAYDLWDLRLDDGVAAQHPDPAERAWVLMVLSGTVVAPPPPGQSDAMRFGSGSTILVPASRCTDHGMVCESAGTALAVGLARPGSSGVA